MNRDAFIDGIKMAILEVEPDAEIILYGSRSREDSTSESDWDFLVLVDGPVDDERTDRIRHRLYDIEWESGEVLSCIVRNRQQWHRSPFRGTPFYQNIVKEGLPL